MLLLNTSEFSYTLQFLFSHATLDSLFFAQLLILQGMYAYISIYLQFVPNNGSEPVVLNLICEL